MEKSKSLNPQNKCSQLKVEDKYNHFASDKLSVMFEMQKALQKRLGKDPDNMSFKDRVHEITLQWRNINCEMAELLERLPFKEWKKYTPAQLKDFQTDEEELETLFEYIDVLHFVMNVGIYLRMDPRMIFNLYVAKNKENFARQDRGY